jgi:CHAT domain-containing protein
LAQDWIARYDSLNDAALKLVVENEYNSATELYAVAFELAETEGDSYRAIEARLMQGSWLMYGPHRDFAKARQILINLENKYGDLFDIDQWAYFYRLMVWINEHWGNFEEALIQAEKAVEYAEISDDSVRLGRSLLDKANQERNLGKYKDSKETLLATLEIAIVDRNLYRDTNLLLFSSYIYLGEWDEGYEYLKAGYDMARQDEDYEDLKSAIYYMAIYQIRNSNLRFGLELLNEGLELAKRTNDDTRVAYYQGELGNLYLQLNEYEKALVQYNYVLQFYSSQEDETQSNQTLLQIGETYSAMREYDEAEKIFTEAFENAKAREDGFQVVYSLITMFELESRRGNMYKAKAYLDSAYAHPHSSSSEKIRNWSVRRYVTAPDSLVGLQLKKMMGRKWLNFSQNRNEQEYLNALSNNARIFEKTNVDSAFYFASKFFEIANKRRAGASAGFFRRLANVDYIDFYFTVGEWQYKYNGDDSKAFRLFEEAKSRALFDELYEAQMAPVFSANNPKSIRLLELQKSVDQLYQKLYSDISEEEKPEIKKQITEMELEYEVKLDAIKREISGDAVFDTPELTTLKKSQELLDDNTLILNYAALKNQLYVMVIGRNSLTLLKVADQWRFEVELTRLVNNYRDGILSQASNEELNVLAEPLLKVLLYPIKNLLTDIDNLVIMPDGPLNLLPFEALRLDGRYLIEDFTIKYLPSISVYGQIQKPHRNTELGLLAIAGTGFEDNDYYFNGGAQPDFLTLPYVLAEVDSVAKNIANIRLLENEDVTEAALKQQPLGKFKYLHFATHGDINELSPSQSGLILSKKINTESLFGEDGFLNAREISQLRLNADMVVLSACDTGTGRVLNGEGVMGLQRAFLIAGASSVVSSLWSIYDRSTPTFMGRFYYFLNEREQEEFGLLNSFMRWANWYEPEIIDYKAKALRDTKLAMINHPYYNHPVHWAAFVITGK